VQRWIGRTGCRVSTVLPSCKSRLGFFAVLPGVGCRTSLPVRQVLQLCRNDPDGCGTIGLTLSPILVQILRGLPRRTPTRRPARCRCPPRARLRWVHIQLAQRMVPAVQPMLGLLRHTRSVALPARPQNARTAGRLLSRSCESSCSCHVNMLASPAQYPYPWGTVSPYDGTWSAC
jgi:hypothetical protein